MNVGLYIPVNIRKIKKAIWLEQVHMVGNMCHLRHISNFLLTKKGELSITIAMLETSPSTICQAQKRQVTAQLWVTPAAMSFTCRCDKPWIQTSDGQRKPTPRGSRPPLKWMDKFSQQLPKLNKIMSRLNRKKWRDSIRTWILFQTFSVKPCLKNIGGGLVGWYFEILGTWENHKDVQDGIRRRFLHYSKGLGGS